MSKPLKQLLKDILPDKLLPAVVGSYDIIGDIAVIIIPDELVDYQNIIGQTLLDNHPNIAVVLKRSGIYEGEYRVLPVEVIAGENRTVTELRESGVRLKLDLQQVYYSVRSGGERLRLARLTEKGERVLVAFSGIAPYPLVIAKQSSAAQIVGVEKNNQAHRYALENLRLNKKLKNIRLYNADILDWLDHISGTEGFDRIIMPLPKSGEPYLEPLLSVLKADGWIHFYDMQQLDNFEQTVRFVYDTGKLLNRSVRQHSLIQCGHCGPRTYRICVDAQFE